MKWNIDKSFSFCYAHRTWVQELIEGYAEDNFCLSCRRLHGHEGTVHVFLESDTLNPQQMVVDFRNLAFYKRFLDDILDHKFILDTEDPLLSTIMCGTLNPASSTLVSSYTNTTLTLVPIVLDGVSQHIGLVVDVTNLVGLEKELYESFVLVDFCPTSENLARWMFDILSEKMSKIGVTVSKVEFNETPKSRATYST